MIARRWPTRRPPIRAGGVVLLLMLGLRSLLLPGTTAAQSSENCTIWTFNICAFSTSALVSWMQVPLMEFLWSCNQRILLLARWLEVLHDWLADQVLATALDVVIDQWRFPFWLIVAVAIAVALVTYLAQVLLVRVRVVNVPSAIGIVLVASVLFRTGVPALAAVEQVRVGLVTGFVSLTAGVVDTVASPLFLVPPDGTAVPPHTIYGDDPCGSLGLQRAVPAIHLNDLAANFLWADARDIHCPVSGTSLPKLPAAFMTGDGKQFSGYLPVYPLDVQDGAEREKLVRRIDDGTNRLITGLVLLAPGAVLEPLWNVLLLIALATIGITVVITLPAGLFVPLAPLFQRQVQGLITVFLTTILSSFWIGLVLGLLALATKAGNGNAVAVVGALSQLVLGWQCWQALMLVLRTVSLSAEAVGVSFGELGNAGLGTARSVGQAALGMRQTALGMGQTAVSGALVATALKTFGPGALVGQMVRAGLARAGTGSVSRAASQLIRQDLARRDRASDRGRSSAADEPSSPWYARRRSQASEQAQPRDPRGRYTRQGNQSAPAPKQDQRFQALERQAKEARSRGDLVTADRLEQEIAQQRQAKSRPPAAPSRQPAAGAAGRSSGTTTPGAAPGRRAAPATPDHQAARQRRAAARRARQTNGGTP